jgi:hypothetical protein
MAREDIQATIVRVAREEGIDPTFALAVADRESSFNPNAHASKTIHGLFQMSGDLRGKYGIGNSTDPEVQTRGWTAFMRDLKAKMGEHLGRAPTDRETYLGHFWGGPRAARVLSGQHANHAPADVFSPYELSINPELARGKNMGGLASNIMGDIDRRQAKFGGTGGAGNDFSQYGENPQGVDFAQFGEPENVSKRIAAKEDEAPQTPQPWAGTTAPWKPPTWAKAPAPKAPTALAQAGQTGGGTSRSTPSNPAENVDMTSAPAAAAPTGWGEEVDLSKYPDRQGIPSPGLQSQLGA